MNIKWGVFELEKLFDIKRGNGTPKKVSLKGNIPYIGSSKKMNGIIEFISKENNSLCKNILGINRTGSVGECFYHPYHCILSENVFQLIGKKRNKYISLYLKACILKQKNKYSYGYTLNTLRMKKQKIKVPIIKINNPNYEYMENYMKFIEKKLLLKK